MCGSNSAQSDAQAQEAAFSRQMMAENAAVYAKQQGILDTLNAGFQKIISAGPSQTGFSDAEDTNLKTQATEDVAANETNASRALGQKQAADGGGDTFVPSGVKQQQQEQIINTGASTDSTLKSQIDLANYNAGTANYDQAVSGEENVAAQLNPVGYSDATTNANNASASEANAIAASANSPFTAVMGALGAVGGAATGALLKP
jgi:hypothetical protein